MRGTAIETLNALGLSWASAMQRSLVEATIVLAIVGLVWVLLRRRMSSALAHGLFLLVLVKAAVPLVLPATPTLVLPLPAPPVFAEDVTKPTLQPDIGPAPRFDPRRPTSRCPRRRESRPRPPCLLASIRPHYRRFPGKPA